MHDGLGAGLNASHVVSHGVKASLGGVRLDDDLELGLAAVELVFPELASGLALLDDEGLGILGVGDHLVDKVGLVSVWSQSWLVEHPAWREPSGNSSSHFSLVVLSTKI